MEKSHFLGDWWFFYVIFGDFVGWDWGTPAILQQKTFFFFSFGCPNFRGGGRGEGVALVGTKSQIFPKIRFESSPYFAHESISRLTWWFRAHLTSNHQSNYMFIILDVFSWHYDWLAFVGSFLILWYWSLFRQCTFFQESMLPNSIAVKPVTTSAPASTGPTKRSLKIEEWKRRKGII